MISRGKYQQFLERVLDVPVVSMLPLDDAYSSDAFKVTVAGGTDVFAKFPRQESHQIESSMMMFLADKTNLPIPKILFVSADCLVNEFLPGSHGLNGGAEHHAADLLAEFHDLSADRFGFEYDTPVGPFMQKNTWADDWQIFFCEQRLLPTAIAAFNEGKISDSTLRLIETIVSQLDHYFPKDVRPALIHGDLWRGNILSEKGRVTAVIDPAIHYGNRESDLAHGMLYDAPFNDRFFARYQEYYSIERDFFSVRRHILNLYPMINHARMFGGDFTTRVEEVVNRFS